MIRIICDNDENRHLSRITSGLRLCLTLILFSTSLFLTSYAEEIAPGMDYLLYEQPGPDIVHVVRIDRDRKDISLSLGFPHKKRNFPEKETVESIFERYDNPPENDVVAAINASFFGDGTFISGAMATGGNYIQAPNSSWPVLAMTPSGELIIEERASSAGGRVTFPDGRTLEIDQLNLIRQPDSIACYSNQWGNSTGTTEQGVEVIVEKVTYPFSPDKEVTGIVSAIKTGEKSVNNQIPENGLVLSAREEKARSLRNKVKKGDRIYIRWDITPSVLSNGNLILTAAGHILHEGVANTESWDDWNESFSDSEHPRTALAWNDEYLFMVVVDGRQKKSGGMTFSELAEFLKTKLGAEEAVNLDGGGSSTMIVNGSLKNSPSDLNGARPVGNALLASVIRRHTSPLSTDNFTKNGRALEWKDKFTFNPVLAFQPKAPKGDGYVLMVQDPSGGYEAVHTGRITDRNYSVEAWFYCEYRPEDKDGGFERYGLFARDNGNVCFESDTTLSGCYALTFESGDGRIRAGKVKEGGFEDLLKKEKHIRKTGWHHFKIRCSDQDIEFYLDDASMVKIEDSEFPEGPCGAGYHEYFDDVSRIHGARIENFRFSPKIHSSGHVH